MIQMHPLRMIRKVMTTAAVAHLHGLARLFMATLLLASLAPSVNAQSLSGLIEPYNDIVMAPPVAGRISATHVREGDRVSEGDVIVELDASIEELEVERRRLIFLDNAELEAARARKELIGEDLQALRSLHERTGSVSREELQRKALEYRLAGLDITRLEQARLREEVEYQMARVQRDLRRIEAPFDGIVTDFFFEIGESIQANQPALRLVADEQCFLVLNIPAERLTGRSVGDTARIRIDTQPPVEKDATIYFIAPVVDPASGLRRVRLLFDNTSPRVEPGVSGRWLQEGR